MDIDITRPDIPTEDGVADAVLAAPVAGGPYPGVLLYMDAIGLRPVLESLAARLAGEGYVVLVPNVLYRAGRASGAEAADLSDPEQRGALFARLAGPMSDLTPERAMEDADAYLASLAADPRVAGGPVGTAGYCMGGALALRTAAHVPDRVAAAASFHGGGLASDAPDSPHRLVDRISGEVYVAHADHDASMPEDAQQRLDEALAAAGMAHRTELYEGAAHGFTMADTGVYDAEADQRHWVALTDLLARNLSR